MLLAKILDKMSMNLLTKHINRKSSLRISLNCRHLNVATALTLIVLVFIISNIFKFSINLIEFYEMVQGDYCQPTKLKIVLPKPLNTTN